MKRIGIIIGSETCPPEDEMKDLRKYYRKHKKQFDESLKFLGLEGVSKKKAFVFGFIAFCQSSISVNTT